MDIDQIIDIYDLVIESTKGIVARDKSYKLRKNAFKEFKTIKGFKKIAFDTRRIDQELEYNPRRGLQNYSRSEAFITEATSQKIISLAKLKDILSELKDKYEKEPEWNDSYARILLNTLDNGLRTGIEDGDYSSNQPAMGSLNYIEELLNTRYRIVLADLNNMSDQQIKKAILSKDEDLLNKKVNDALKITKQDVSNNSYDTLLDKLFNGVKATKENKNVQRTVTITIKDTFLDEE